MCVLHLFYTYIYRLLISSQMYKWKFKKVVDLTTHSYNNCETQVFFTFDIKKYAICLEFTYLIL